jgi:hypothetical protein
LEKGDRGRFFSIDSGCFSGAVDGSAAISAFLSTYEIGSSLTILAMTGGAIHPASFLTGKRYPMGKALNYATRSPREGGEVRVSREKGLPVADQEMIVCGDVATMYRVR